MCVYVCVRVCTRVRKCANAVTRWGLPENLALFYKTSQKHKVYEFNCSLMLTYLGQCAGVVCCSVLQDALAVCSSVLQCVIVCCSVLLS